MSSTATPVAQSAPVPASAGVESAPETEAAGPTGSASDGGTSGPGFSGRKAATDYADYRLVPARHPWRWVGTAVVALGVAGIAWSLATNRAGSGAWWRNGSPRSRL